MRFGFRTLSLTKRIAARTSVKRIVRHSLGFKAPHGFGWFTNPKRALYNRIYNRMTLDFFTFLKKLFGSAWSPTPVEPLNLAEKSITTAPISNATRESSIDGIANKKRPEAPHSMEITTGMNLSNASAYAIFAGIPFGLDHAEVRRLMTSKGYVFDYTDTNYEIYKGIVANTGSDIIMFYDDSNALAKVCVNLQTSEHDFREKYSQLHDQLIKKYGNPKQDYHFFQWPYSEEDEYQDTPFLAGKAVFSAYWPQPDAVSQLSITITMQLRVSIAYEGPTWPACADARRDESVQDL